MKTAQPILIPLTIIMVAAGLALPKSVQAAAGSLQLCEPSSTCKVGEFLYDDSYVPITNATCTITAKYPDGTTLYSSQAMTAGADGYYSYQFTSPATTGMYPTQVCCTSTGSYLCLDKSFEIKAATSAPSTSDISSAVWGYSNRTLSGFGNLISDIWGYSSRSLSSLLVGTTNITNNITNIENTANETRLLLEQLVNKPIIETSLDDDGELDLNSKIKDTKSIANQLYVNSQYLTSKSRTLSTKYKTFTSSQINNQIEELSSILGTSDDLETESSLYSGLNWFKESWDFPILGDLGKQAKKVRDILARLEKKSINSKGKIAASEINVLALEAARLEKLVGNISDNSGEETLFGEVKEIEETALALDTKSQEIDKTLSFWNSFKAEEKESKVKSFLRAVLSLNILPKIKDNVISTKLGISSDDKQLKNSLLSMRGVLGANKIYLAKKNGKTVLNTWLEEGSVVFKTLVTNPYTLISQTIKVEYFLPQEVKEEHILEKDEGLEVKYNSEKDQYYVSGEISLGKGESKTLSVKVDDIWQIKEGEMASRRNQAEELFKALEKTSFFAQGVTLKSDINVSLDKAVSLLASAHTPEAKIRAYREADIEMKAVDEKMDKLQELVTQAGSAGNLFGFVGGAQALAVWGLIIILVAGFVFLAIYMRTLSNSENHKNSQTDEGNKEKVVSSQKPRLALHLGLIILGSALVSGAISALITWKVVSKADKSLASATPQTPEVLGEETKIIMPTPTPEPEKEEAFGGEETVLIEVEKGSAVNVYVEPSDISKIVTKIKYTQTATKVGEEGDWINISLNSFEGWVDAKYVALDTSSLEESETKELPGDKVLVGETETGWLRVREAPLGTEIGRVYPGDILDLVDVNGEWFLVSLDSGESGWISSKYASVE